MPIAPLLQRFVDDELKRSADLIAQTLTGTLEQLRPTRDKSLSAADRQHRQDVAQVVQQHQASYQRSFVDGLRAFVQADLAPPSAPKGRASPSLDGGMERLELMDESRVFSDIEISRAIQQIDTAAEWELRELQTFTATLRGQEHVTADSNPLRPQAYARALWQAASALPMSPVHHATLLRVSASVMARLLRLSFAAACTRLENQGITPGLYRTVVLPAGGALREEPPQMDVTRPGALDGLLRAMPTGDIGTLGDTQDRRRPLPMAPPALEEALLRVDDLLRRMPAVAPAEASATAPSANGSSPRLAEHRAALMATTSETVDRQIIELLSRLFETVLADRALPPELQAVIARLQVSALRIALLDPSMLDAYDHPVWVLLDRIVDASTSYAQPSDPRLAALLSFCQSLVSDMAAQPLQDTALYRASLSRLDTFLAEQLSTEQQAARRAADALRRAEEGEQLQRTLSARLVEQIARVPASAAIDRFVTVTWARVLAESVLRHGDQNEQTLGYLKAVDDLIWSLNPPDHPQSRQRLVTMLPVLLQRLRDGMGLIELPTAEQHAVLDELMKTHAEVLRPGARGRAATADETQTPEEIVRRMREELSAAPTLRTEDIPAFSDSLIDLQSMETVPAELMNAGEHGDADSTEPARMPGEWVHRMAVGGRYRIFLHGGWTQVQLLWRSDLGQFFLFSADTPGRTHSVSRRALERLREAQLLGPLHAHTLIQRAVDGMLRTLSRPS